jgi:hypothetical protein
MAISVPHRARMQQPSINLMCFQMKLVISWDAFALERQDLKEGLLPSILMSDIQKSDTVGNKGVFYLHTRVF